ncbi:hypothetical protein MMC16_001941 [Acarospora aff. strigata]|nr:hypothetical protein [Acarospora aff. strigata]
MTVDDVQAILKDLTELEFPKIMGFSIIFALFKTYGIPSVSSLLVATGELATSETASKRTADTGVLLLEFALNKPSSDRTIQAIARMNYLHSQYQKSGKITDSDMLYTLSLFALEPTRWIDRYEWRNLTALELCASGTFWKAMGDAMKIPYDALPSCKNGWKDGLHWLEEVKEWSLRYEEAYMIPADTNRRLAESHLNLLFINLPVGLMDIGKRIVTVFLDDRLRKAMMFPESPSVYHVSLNSVFYMRKCFLRYLALPRPEFLRKKYIPSKPNPKTGRYNAVEYLSHPWRKLPGDDGNKYAPEGYAFADIGPKSFQGKGRAEMEETLIRLTEQKRGGCPFG